MPIITAWAALFCGVLFFALTFQVVAARRASGVSLGDGGDQTLMRRMRGQANAAEQMPLSLITLLAAEMMGAPLWLLIPSALLFCLGRLMHGIAFGWLTHSPLRLYGMVIGITGTAGILIALAWSLIL